VTSNFNKIRTDDTNEKENKLRNSHNSITSFHNVDQCLEYSQTSLRWTGIEINRKICEKYDQRHSVALIIFNYGYKKEKTNRLSCSISVKSRR